MLNKEEILETLRNKVAEVKFVKKDGTERVMKATLLKEYVEPKLGNSSTQREEPEDVVTCIDTEINEWRRFKIDSIISFDDKK